jgi:hypothetical protein
MLVLLLMLLSREAIAGLHMNKTKHANSFTHALSNA